jgi:WD40 repeat protein
MMKSSVFFLALLTVFPCSCSPSPSLAVADQDNSTVSTSSPAPSATPLSTATIQPSAPSTPTLTPTPAPTDHPGWMPEGVITRFGKGGLVAIDASPDSSLVALAATGGIYLADPLTGRTVDFIETGSDVQDVEFSPNSKQLYIGLGTEGIQIWSQTAGGWQPDEPLSHICGSQVAISADGATLFAKCFSQKDNTLTSWDLAGGKQNFRQTFVTPKQIGFAMVFSPTDPKVAAVANYDIVKLIDAKTGNILKTYSEPNKNIVTDVDFSPDGKLLAISPYSPAVVILNAETLEEIRRTVHKTDVYLLSFLDNENIISFDKENFVIQSVDGKILRTLSHDGDPLYAFVPGLNIVVADANFTVNFISLDTYRVVAKMEGFHPYRWVYKDISGDGNAFLGNINSLPLIWYSYADQPDHVEVNKAAEICPEKSSGKYLDVGARFLDNAGKYLVMQCEEKNRLVVFETKGTSITFGYPNPLWMVNNADSYFHPWKDNRELQALLYENPDSSTARYRIEIWELLKNNKLSSFDVDVSEAPVIRFSPGSAFLGVIDTKKNTLLIYETISGQLKQSIPFDSKLDTLYFDERDTMIFTSRAGSIKNYSIESGELLQTYKGLSSGEPQGMAYFDASQTLVWYYIRGEYAFFDLFDPATGNKVATHAIKLPTDRQIGTIIYLPPAGLGKLAVVANPGNIFFIDLLTDTITKTYQWKSDNLIFPPIAIENYLIIDENPIFFKMDLMAGE